MGNGRSRPASASDALEMSLRRAAGANAALRAVPVEQVMEENISLNYITDILVFPGIFTVTHLGHLKLVDTVLKSLEAQKPPRDALLIVMPYSTPKHSYFCPPDESSDPEWRLLPDAVFDHRIAMLCAAMATLNRKDRVYVCSDMLGDMGDSGRIMEAYELIRTMASWRWPTAKIHCLCGSDSLDYIQRAMARAISPKRSTTLLSGGQSIYCVSVGDEPLTSRRADISESADGFAPGQSGEICRSHSTVETLRVLSAACHATVDEFMVPGLEMFSTRDICRSLSQGTTSWELHLPNGIVEALKDYRDASRKPLGTKKEKRTKSKK